MQQVTIKKRCRYIPGDAADLPENRILVNPGQVVTVTDERAEKMVAGNVAALVQVKAPKKKAAPKAEPKPKKGAGK